MATSDISPGSEVTVTEELPTITGKKCFILEPEQTFKSKEEVKRQILQQMPDVQEVSKDECDFIVVLCFIVSRAGTDIDATVNALNGISESKPAVFVVLHHTFDPEMIVLDSSSVIKRSKTLAVDCLFHEDEGLLKSVKNDEAQRTILQCLQPQEHNSNLILICKQSTNLNRLHHLTNHSRAESLKKPTLWNTLKSNVCTFFSPHQDENCPKTEELTFFLLGMSGSEQTIVGDVILDREETQDSPTQKTKDFGVVDGQQVTVIYTPNWFSLGLSIEDIKRHLKFCVDCFSARPHAFLLIIPVKEFTEDEREIVKKIEMSFEGMCVKVMILFTVTDEQQKLNIPNQEFQTLKDTCGNWFHVLNINQRENRGQVSELLKDVDKMLKNEPFEMI